MTSITDAMVTGMSDTARQGLRDQLTHAEGGLSLTMSTACSGTDVCVTAAGSLLSSLQRILGLDGRMVISQGFACELEGFKQDFLHTVRQVPVVFKDILHLGCSMSVNSVTQREEAVKTPDILVIGFSCKDLSSLNPKKKQTTSLSSGSGSSGSTLRGTLEICSKHQPRLLIMENVPNVMRDGPAEDEEDDELMKNWPFLVSSFASIGYAVHKKLINADQCGFPQSRGRIYMCACRPTSTTEEMLQAFDKAYLAIQNVDALKLTDFLLTDEQVNEWDMRSTKRLRTNEKPEGVTWVSHHSAVFREKNLEWPPPPEMTRRVQHQDVHRPLTVREAEVLIFHDQVSPLDETSGEEEVLDLSQDIRRVRPFKGKSCCLTPHGIHWMRRAGRRMRGEEMLHLQGLFVADRADLFRFSDSQLRDLAGNAFNAGAFAMALLAALQVVDFS